MSSGGGEFDQTIASALAWPQTKAGAGSTIHHIAFATSDVGLAIRHWSAALSIGPFCRITDPDPAAPRPAFVWWGSVFIELLPMSQGDTEHDRLVSHFDHVSYMTTVPAEESERLVNLGLTRHRDLRHGPVWAQQHDGGAKLGCSIEIHRAGTEMGRFFDSIRTAALSWDGIEMERSIQPPH